jgi:hypothetical protein
LAVDGNGFVRNGGERTGAAMGRRPVAPELVVKDAGGITPEHRMQRMEDALLQFREPVAPPAANRLAIRPNRPAQIPSAVGAAPIPIPPKINCVNAAAGNQARRCDWFSPELPFTVNFKSGVNSNDRGGVNEGGFNTVRFCCGNRLPRDPCLEREHARYRDQKFQPGRRYSIVFLE